MNGGVIWSNAAAVFDKSIMGGAIQLKANKNSLVVGLVGPLRWKEGGGGTVGPLSSSTFSQFVFLLWYFRPFPCTKVGKWNGSLRTLSLWEPRGLTTKNVLPYARCWKIINILENVDCGCSFWESNSGKSIIWTNRIKEK